MKYLLLIVLMMTGCAMQQTSSASLYSRIGGKPILAMISSETVDIIANDPRTMRSFDGVKLQPIKDSITDFLCVKTGGQCVYEGETMVNSHAEAEITSAEFELMVQVMRDVLDANRIADREKNELLRILAPMKKEIVTK
jgi:hemoglobin